MASDRTKPSQFDTINLDCPVCFEEKSATYVLLLSAHREQRLDCRHHFCKPCAEKSLGRGQCHVCRQPVFDVREDAMASQLARSLKAASAVAHPLSPEANQYMLAIVRQIEANDKMIGEINEAKTRQIMKIGYARTIVKSQVVIEEKAFPTSAKELIKKFSTNGRVLRHVEEMSLFGKINLMVSSYEDIVRVNKDLKELAPKLARMAQASRGLAVVLEDAQMLGYFLIEICKLVSHDASSLPALQALAAPVSVSLQVLDSEIANRSSVPMAPAGNRALRTGAIWLGTAWACSYVTGQSFLLIVFCSAIGMFLAQLFQKSRT